MFGKTISRVFVWESDLFVKVLFKKKKQFNGIKNVEKRMKTFQNV